MVQTKVKKGDIVILKVKRSGTTFVNFKRYAGYVEYIFAEVVAATREGELKQARTATHTFRAGEFADCFTIADKQDEARAIFGTSPEPWGNLEDIKTALTCQHTDFDEDQNGNRQCRRCAVKIEVETGVCEECKAGECCGRCHCCD